MPLLDEDAHARVRASLDRANELIERMRLKREQAEALLAEAEALDAEAQECIQACQGALGETD